MPGGHFVRTYDPTSVMQAVYRRFFENIQIDDEWLGIVREAAQQGPVVYVLRNLSFLDFMALDYITARYGLPRLRFANDLGLWMLEPFASTWAEALVPSRRIAPDERLVEVIEDGGSAALFLKRPPTILEKATGRGKRRVSFEGDLLIASLFSLQRRLDRPIMLVPQVFVWSKRPESLEPSALDFVLGPREWPGRLRSAAQFLLNYRNVILRAGEPVNLRQFLADNAGEPQDTLIRRGTYALLRKVDRERRAILGPMRKPADRVREEIIRSPKLQHTISQLAGEGRAERMLLTARAYRMLRQMEAAPDPEAIFALSTVVKTVVNVMYAGIEVDREGLARVREASQKGTLILLPSHKSHIDYLLLSHVLHLNALQLPLIAAGDNLSFFPIGMLLRRGGAFFIRRTFRGDRLYAAVVDAYLRRIIKDGWPIEVFLEGTRSRTGKLLPPKLGLLSMIIDSGLSLAHRDLQFVPVSIGYERLVEEGSYVRELLGGEKKKEDTAALIRASKVLAERYGRLNVQFGEVFSLNQMLEEAGLTRDPPPTPSQRRDLVKRVAFRVMARINQVTAATPGALIALALLSHNRRGMSHAELANQARSLLSVLLRRGARTTPALAMPSGTLRPACVRETTSMFEQAGLIQVHFPGEVLEEGQKHPKTFFSDDDIIYSVPDNKRLALDLSKNIIIHFFVPMALVSIAMLTPPGPPVPAITLQQRVERLSRLFKHEFMFPSDRRFETLLDETLNDMRRAGEIELDAPDRYAFGSGHDGIDGRGWVVKYSSMLRNFLEGYLVAARGLHLLIKGPMTTRDLVRKTLAVGDKMFLAGEIERKEALSGRCIENALLSFADQGYVRTQDAGKKIELVSSFADAEAVRAIELGIANFLPRGASDRDS
jgi:glycerol-3-phosphate O-acyltransferase